MKRTIRIGRAFLLGLLFSGAASAWAGEPFSTCGIFKVEGLLQESSAHKGFLEIVTDQNARSERRIVLGKMSSQELKDLNQLRVSGRVRIHHFCMSQCYGQWLGTDRMLAPDETSKSFSAGLVGARQKSEECMSIEAAKEKVTGK
jgi:hypothetical protein